MKSWTLYLVLSATLLGGCSSGPEKRDDPKQEKGSADQVCECGHPFPAVEPCPEICPTCRRYTDGRPGRAPE